MAKAQHNSLATLLAVGKLFALQPKDRESGLSEQRLIHYYFVDEAGDLTLFGRRGKVLVGTPGCSRFFMLGVAQLPDPAAVERALNALRTGLLADPYFKGVPSMRPERRRTAMFFHAKNDLP